MPLSLLSFLLSPLSLHATAKSAEDVCERVSGVNFLVPEKEGEDGPEEVERRVEEFGDGRRRQKGRKECLRRERKRGATERERERKEDEFPPRASPRDGKFPSREKRRERGRVKRERKREREVRNRERMNL